MNYLSTRGDATPRKFCEILLEGLAPDGGLYLPANYPQINDIALQKLRDIHTKHGYADLAFAILSLYIDDIPAADLQALCRKTYTQEVYGTKDIVPLKELDDKVYLEALSNGPTLAFKDMAMQLLGNLFEYELARRHEELNIFGATSGDTGSAGGSLGGGGGGGKSPITLADIQLDYATATQTVFYVMAGVMAVCFVVALVGSPKGKMEEVILDEDDAMLR